MLNPDLAQPGLVKSGLSIPSRNKSGLSNNLQLNVNVNADATRAFTSPERTKLGAPLRESQTLGASVSTDPASALRAALPAQVQGPAPHPRPARTAWPDACLRAHAALNAQAFRCAETSRKSGWHLEANRTRPAACDRETRLRSPPCARCFSPARRKYVQNMRKVMLLLALLFALSSAAPPPLESALEPALKELRSKDSGKDNLKLMTHEDYPKRTHGERMLSMAYTLKNHFAHKPLTLKVAQDAIDAHVANGKMPAEHKLLLATEVGTLLGPAAAAAAGLEVTAEDIDEAVGEGGSTGKHLEEGGAEGMDGEEEERSTGGDMELSSGELSGDEEFTIHDMKFRGATSLYTAGAGKPWTNKKVNYCFAVEAKPAVRQVIARSVEMFKKVLPCIEWQGMHTHSLAHFHTCA